MIEKVKINKEAKEYILTYLEGWINHLSKFDFSFRKGIVRAIYNKIEVIPILEDKKQESNESDVATRINGISVHKNKLGLSDEEALYLLDALVASYREGYYPLTNYCSCRDALQSVDDSELLFKLGISKEDYEKFLML